MTDENLMGTANPTEGTQQNAAAEAPTGGDAAAAQQQPAAEQNQQAAEPAAAVGAPEVYDFKAAEGKEFDSNVISAFSDAARELNLTQEAAQKMLDKMAPALEARQTEQVEAVRNAWAESSKADKEFGGEKISENMGIAQKALEKFGTQELRTLLEESGLGNHPEVIRFMFRAGKALSEDTYVGSSQGAGAPKAAGVPKDFAGQAEALYGNK